MTLGSTDKKKNQDMFEKHSGSCKGTILDGLWGSDIWAETWIL